MCVNLKFVGWEFLSRRSFLEGLGVVKKNSILAPISIRWPLYWFLKDTFSVPICLLCCNKRLVYTFSWSALCLGVILCFSCKRQKYSQSTAQSGLGTKSMLHVFWLTYADEINSFSHSIPNFDTWHLSILDSIVAVCSYHTNIEVWNPTLWVSAKNPAIFW